MQQILPLVPIGIFFVVLLLVGYVVSYQANRATSFKKEYFLGSQNLGGVVLAMTLVATYGSVSSFVSGPGVAWNLGLGWVVFAAPQIITGFLILGLVGKRMTILAHRTESLTVIDLLFERFQSRLVAVLLAVMLIIFFLAMIVGQFIGGAQIFAGLTDIDYSLGLVIFALVTVLYSSGGFRAVAITDAICAILMLTGMFILGFVIVRDGGGLEGIMDTLATVNIDEQTGVSRNLEYNAGGALPLGLLFSAWILVGFATVGLPQSLVRCMSYKSSQDLHKAMVIATVICGALMIGMTMLGVFARAVITDLPAGGTDAVIPTLIAHKMHPLVAGVTILGPLAATMSTVSSLLIASASAIIRDLFKALRPEHQQVANSPIADAVKPALSYHEKIIIKGTTLVMGIIAITLALFPLDIVVWVNLFAFGGLESAFVWPVVLGLFWRKFNTCGVLTSLIAALGVYTVCSVFKISFLSCHAIAVFHQTMSKRTHNIFFPHRPWAD